MLLPKMLLQGFRRSRGVGGYCGRTVELQSIPVGRQAIGVSLLSISSFFSFTFFAVISSFRRFVHCWEETL